MKVTRKIISLVLTTSIIIFASISIIIFISFQDIEEVAITHISVPEKSLKGENVTIEVQFTTKRSIIVEIITVSFTVISLEYDYSVNFEVRLNKHIERAADAISFSIPPVLDTNEGTFALNTGNYILKDFLVITSAGRLLSNTSRTFKINDRLEEEQLRNTGFEEETKSWDIKTLDNRIKNTIVPNGIEKNSFQIKILEKIHSWNTTHVELTQNINLTETHFISFQQEVTKAKVDFDLIIDERDTYDCVRVTEYSEREQFLFFGNETEIKNITLRVKIIEGEIGGEILLDNLSIKSYEYKVFLVILDNNWRYDSQANITRESITETIKEVSIRFRDFYGVSLIPLIEKKWVVTHNEIREISDAYQTGINDAGKILKLKGPWEGKEGKSRNNNGFDMLVCFSNFSASHFGFVKKRNVAFHFAQSEYLQEAINEAGLGWIQVKIKEDWADNLAQHEISHIFGALDRDRRYFPPSVMTKSLTPEDVINDLMRKELWLQIDNWLIQDARIIITSRAMFR